MASPEVEKPVSLAALEFKPVGNLLKRPGGLELKTEKVETPERLICGVLLAHQRRCRGHGVAMELPVRV
jgi:hypothetical protein